MSTNGGRTATTTRDRVLRKCGESIEVKRKFFDRYADQLGELCQHMAERFQSGGRLWTMGNGGSACDAEHVAVEFCHPIIEKRRPLPATALGSSNALLTAVGNDTDFSRVFVVPLELQARPGDMVLGISTSGAS